MSKPNITLVYDSSIRNNGTPVYMNYGFQEAGYNVERFTPLGGEIPKRDFYIYIDDGRDDIDWTLPGPYGYYAIDTHLGFEYRYKQAKNASIVWCAQLSGVRAMQDRGILARWLPLACSPLAHPTADEMELRGVEKPRILYDLAFVGHIQPGDVTNRMIFLDAVFKAVEKTWFEYGVFHEDMAAAYHTARMGLNHSIRGDLNMRFFELASIGVPQICQNMEGLDKLGFKPYVHYLPYEDSESVVMMANEVYRHVMAWPRSVQPGVNCRALATNALTVVRYGHTYKHRALRMVQDAQERKLM